MRTYTFPMAKAFDEPAGQPPPALTAGERGSAAAIAVGLLLLLSALVGAPLGRTWLGPAATFGLLTGGGVAWFWLRYRGTTPGIKHNGLFFSGARSRGALGWTLGVLITGFYVLLYWFPSFIEGGVRLVDPVSAALARKPADRWFLYGFLYTMSMIVFGVRMLMKYRHNRYHLIRTASVVVFQLGLAFLIPQLLKALSQPEFYFTYFWPLKPDYLYPDGVRGLAQHPGGIGIFMVFWGAVMTFVATPLLTYFFGKRWYCSWVCGCGGLAETVGDPFRHLSDKSSGAWKIERRLIHSILVIITLTTALLWLNEAKGGAVLGSLSFSFRKHYGFYIGMLFSGVAGVGFYPILGSRVWCRFGCPMAAILGLLQRFFSRFRISTNGGQCMSCGNCSTHCEMGIDVRAYAQRGENIVRASCVGCGVCAAVCPRGVLRLENGRTHKDRYPGADQPLRALLQSLGLAPRPRGRNRYFT
ncbi:MAG: 4Fe-4S binding protein [Candidatus Krumholzibacteriia bacterium]